MRHSRPAYRPRAAVNWPLWLGLLLSLAIGYLALSGPGLAPKDPLKENFILFHDTTGEYYRPPVQAFVLPGYPLGADTYGRDVLSQLLWAVRPTLTLVLVVAAVRLVIGLMVGLASGWSDRLAGRLLDNLISAALSVPVLFVALFILAAAGSSLGVWGFIVGLSLTGWAEAGRLVREQTRVIRQMPYVEAARALGATDSDLIIRHVLPQIMPLVWILLAFEVSSTLLAVAGLGFLGYFAHSIWVPLGDWTVIRASGRPELGQMLASLSLDPEKQSWSLLAAGAMVFMMILAFNLLGEGLRRQLSPEAARQRRRRDTPLDRAARQVQGWVEDRWFDPLSPWRRNLMIGSVAAVLGALILGGGVSLWRAQALRLAESQVKVPGGHLWAVELHDSQGTLWSDVAGPRKPDVAWTFFHPAGFAGGPALAADEVLYLVTGDSQLLALAPSGETLWRADLPAPGYGTPALGPDGDIYVLDVAGGVSDFTPRGETRWTIQPDPGQAPLASPIIDSQGTLYYPTSEYVVAVTLDGVVKWKVPLPTYSYLSPLLRLSQTGEYVFFEDMALDSQTGAVALDATLDLMDRYLVGADGATYLQQQAALLEVDFTPVGAEIRPHLQWDMRALGLFTRYPNNAGLAPDGRAWIYYATGFEFTKMLWINQDGSLQAALDFPWRGTGLAQTTRLIALDDDSVAYLCGVSVQQLRNRAGPVDCRAHRPQPGPSLWETTLEHGGFPMGGALAPGRLYVATLEGYLYAIGVRE